MHLHQLYLLLDRHGHLVDAVLKGRLTIRDAQDIAAGTCDLDDVILGSRYEGCHRALVAEAERLDRNKPPITAPVASVAALERELETMPLVEDLFKCGDLTLVQTRFAHRMGLSGEALDAFIDRARRKRTEVRKPARRSPSPVPVVSAVCERERLLGQVPAGMRDGFRHTPTEHIQLYLSVTASHRSTAQA